MSITSLPFMSRAVDLGPRRASHPVLLALVVALPIALAMSWPRAVTIWQAGTFFDTDDAMRAVQLRDWMAGQGWFDLTAHRLAPPDGLFMHWSRVVDVPLAVLVRCFALVLPPDLAERATRIAFPVALQAGLIAVMAVTARILAGSAAAVPAALLIVLGGISYGQFVPGRIDHHAPQILLLTLMTAASLASLDPARARSAALAGVYVAVSLAISLENLPFMVAILAAAPVAWAIAGQRMRAPLLWLALGLAVTVPAAFIATVAPSRYRIVSVDAFSILHLAAMVLGAAGLVTLSLATRLCPGATQRWGVLAGTGVVVVLLLKVLFPTSLHGPYDGIDAMVQSLWLDHVTEAQPLLDAIRDRPDTFSLVTAPLLAGGGAAVVALLATHGLARARWALVVALIVIGFAGALWEVRVASSLQPLALLGGAWAVARAAAVARERARPLGWALATGLLLLFSSVGWAFVPMPAMSSERAVEIGGGQACRDAGALAPLAMLPAGLAFAPIDLGSHLLAETRVSVVAAPYHRNIRGNRTVLQGFLASPEAARQLVAATGARYVILCPGSVQTSVLAKAAPDGLAAALVAGRVPAWLRPMPLPPTPYRVYAVD